MPIPEEGLECPHCHSANTKFNGYVYTKKKGKSVKTDKQRRKCNDCGKGWTPPTEAKSGVL